MARSTYIYVATWMDHVQSSAPLISATVKREFLDALAPLKGLDDMDIWRMGDGAAIDRRHLGSGAEFLARERPPVVAEVPGG